MDDKITSGKEEQKKGKTDRDRAQVEPVPKRLDFFEWIEKLFYREPEEAQFPRKIEVNPVRGRLHEQLGKSIYQKIFEGADAMKPTRPKIVEISNEILFRAQRDCDIQRKRTVYGVHIWHFALDSNPYERWLLAMKPTLTYRSDGEPRDEGDDEETTEARFSIQVLRHHESMFGFYGGGFEGLLDRMDRIIERQDTRIEKQDVRIEKLVEMMEKALSLEADREHARAWNTLKIRSAEKGLDMGFALAPPLLNQLLGKSVIPTGETAETITLKKFFQPKSDGGLLTPEQSDAAFGTFDTTPAHNLIKPGVLSLEQAKILYDVAHCLAPADDLEKLMPGGPAEITRDQVNALTTQCGFSMEQIVPLHLIFEARFNRRKANSK